MSVVERTTWLVVPKKTGLYIAVGITIGGVAVGAAEHSMAVALHNAIPAWTFLGLLLFADWSWRR